jgi:toxin YhaV
MTSNYKVAYFKLFHDQYYQLAKDVKAIAEKSPKDYKSHPKTKLLAKVYKVVHMDICNDPTHKCFRLGNTLGPKYRTWKRAKSGLPDRYRLFFMYRSNERKSIIAWMNNEFSLRQQNGKNDPYIIFKKMLDNKKIPSNWNELKKGVPSKVDVDA